MPELPEVETVARSLDELVTGRLITGALLHREKLAPGFPPETFSALVSGKKITSVGRRGKHILIGLDGDMTLIVHLRMSGRFLLLNGESENPRFTHAEFFFSDRQRLVFQDLRHFGYMNLVKTDALGETPELRKLAPEPFSAEFSRQYLRKRLLNSKLPVKSFLLDQTKVCGLGNIYAAEAMFLARVNPQTRANEVSAIKANRLHRRIKEVLSVSIGYSMNLDPDPLDMEKRFFDGDEGHWLVYGREGLPCAACGSTIRRIRQGGRSSYFCPRCQRK